MVPAQTSVTKMIAKRLFKFTSHQVSSIETTKSSVFPRWSYGWTPKLSYCKFPYFICRLPNKTHHTSIDPLHISIYGTSLEAPFSKTKSLGWWRNMGAEKNNKTLPFFLAIWYTSIYILNSPYYSPLFRVTSAARTMGFPLNTTRFVVLLKHWSRRLRVLSFSKYDLSCKGGKESTSAAPSALGGSSHE